MFDYGALLREAKCNYPITFYKGLIQRETKTTTASALVTVSPSRITISCI